MKSRLRVGVIDLVAPGRTGGLYSRALLPNFATVMAQAVARWCEEDGHEVLYRCYTGRRDARSLLGGGEDVVFVCAFTHAALTAYALASAFRADGTITVLGGPHARAWPADAARHFDFVLGLTDRELVRSVLAERAPRRGQGVVWSARRQPVALPGVRERWRFIEEAQRGAWVRGVPMLGSLGCPYTCSFCIDAEVPYQTLDLESIKEDLRFLLRQPRRPRVVWHDPNFGVRFDEYLDAIEEVVPPGAMNFVAESSLSLLSDAHLQRLRRNGFVAMLPGVESWFELGNKSRTGALRGPEKVVHVAGHVNRVLEHVPYVQTNFVMGLDSDAGPEPFDLTADFIDAAPGSFVAAAMLTVYGESAPIGEACRREKRLLPVPFTFLNSGYVTNVKPKGYSWQEYYDRMIGLLRHAFGVRAIARRHRAVRGAAPRLINLVRALSAEGRGRAAFLARMRRRLAKDSALRRFMEGETTEVPEFFGRAVRRSLGPLWSWLPEGALRYDPSLTATQSGRLHAFDA